LAAALVDKETLDQDDLSRLLGDLPDWSRQAQPLTVGKADQAGPPEPGAGVAVPVAVRTPVATGLRRILGRSPSKPATA
jgi:hypothetical protein